MAKKLKPFSEKALQAVFAKALSEGKPLYSAAAALFESMETEKQAQQRELLESQPEAAPTTKRRSIPKAASKAESKPKAKAKSKPKSGYGAQRGK